MVTVLDPVPDTGRQAKPPCQPAGSIKGKTIGLRRNYWVSWDYVTDGWAQFLEKDGAKPVLWRASVSKGEEETAAGGEGFHRFLKESDIAITGACSRGRCTIWAVHHGPPSFPSSSCPPARPSTHP